MVISPVKRTYNHVSIFLFSSTKKDLNCQHEQYLRLLNSHTCLQLLSSPRNVNLFRKFFFWFGPPSLIFLKICQMVICPVRRRYNHVSIFLFSNTKKALNNQVEQYLRLLNFHICFNLFREFVRW